jgi:dipeptidyl-peptidase 4
MNLTRPGALRAAALAAVTLFGLAAVRPAPARADEGAKKALDLEALYSPDAAKRVNFMGAPQTNLGWLDATHFLVRSKEGGLVSVEARSGRTSPWIDAAKMQAAFAKLPGFSTEDAAAVAHGCPELDPQASRFAFGCELRFALSADHKAAVINTADDLFYYRFGDDAATRLTHDPQAEELEEFSPDGRFVSFVRDGNLAVVEVATGRERALTTDGGAKLFNGKLDWVYQEEIYGRGDFRGYWWSPDSHRIAFLRLDESPVLPYTVVDHVPLHPVLEVTPYPLAGDPNPIVSLGVVPAVGGETVWVDLERYRTSDPLVVGVGWTPDSAKVVAQVQDREQTWLDLDLADPGSGAVSTLFRDRSQAFIESGEHPWYLADGSFLWPTMRSGWKHVYHYAADGKQLAELTPGEWEIQDLLGVDEAHGVFYVTSNRDVAPESQLFRIGLDGSGPTRISRRPGTHRPHFSPDFALYLDAWSDSATPMQVRLHAADGGEIRTVDENHVAAVDEYGFSPVEFFQVAARDGVKLEALMIKPPDFDPAKRYPVLIYQYGGPHAPVVENRWDPYGGPWNQLLAQHGYVIFACDNRSASGKGYLGTFQAYKHMGVVELRDTEDAVGWLRAQSWVDPDRIGIWGWSYGGFQTSFDLTHSTSFKVGIAGAPVTDWHLYDTVYTERYMLRPQNNPEGYEETSVVGAAANLHGKLLLLHGTTDDNVHLQNSIKFIYELERAGKTFDLALYPKSRHGPSDRKLIYQMRTLMTDFIEHNL